MNTDNLKQENIGNVLIGLTFRPEDWSGRPVMDSFDEQMKSAEEKKEQTETQSEFKTLSMERIVENERLRDILELYLDDVERLGWANLSDEELYDVVLNSIMNHNEYFALSSYDRVWYKKLFRRWKKSKKRLTNYSANQPTDEYIGKNFNGLIPLSINSARGYREQTTYYCRYEKNNWLYRIKLSVLKRLAKGQDINKMGLDLESKYSEDRVG